MVQNDSSAPPNNQSPTPIEEPASESGNQPPANNIEVANPAKEKTPKIMDYIAAGFLAYGLTYFWNLLMEIAPPLSIATIPIYILCGAFPTYLICQRTTKEHLLIGLKCAIFFGLITNFLMYLWRPNDFNNLFILSIIITFLAGCLGSSFLSMKQQTKMLSKKI